MNEETNGKRKKCTYCYNYEGYYIKGLHCFESIRKGYCSIHNKIVDCNSCCDFWKTGNHRFYMRKKVASRALYEILFDISAIRQILLENQEEGKTYNGKAEE